MIIHIKSLDECYTLGRILNKRTHRLLAEYKKDKSSDILVLKEDIPNYREFEKKDISYCIKGEIRKIEKSNKPLHKERFYTQVTDDNKGIIDKKYFHFEKKWVNKKDYGILRDKSRKISENDLKKIKFRSYGFIVTLFSIFFLFGIVYPVLEGLNMLKELKNNLLGILGNIIGDPTAVQHYICSIFFGVLISILAIIIIITIPKILINNEKYKKFKLMDEKMYNK
ncbi:Plasmodium exported protein (Pm-fam-a like), unknown function [Plasmodium malariae]|uniref:Fam-m protein n=2 Tax=Plasmodium (Plasmodium) TaxID=418103 RepID=A0A1A8WI90_PLAMA|nr:Plasmodium exported protein (Pm-fam-a like), unknown function [Plasmodium malariae]